MYKIISANAYVPNWSEEYFVIKKFESIFRGHMLLVILTKKKLLARFTKKNCKGQKKKNLGWKSNRVYVK